MTRDALVAALQDAANGRELDIRRRSALSRAPLLVPVAPDSRLERGDAGVQPRVPLVENDRGETMLVAFTTRSALRRWIPGRALSFGSMPLVDVLGTAVDGPFDFVVIDAAGPVRCDVPAAAARRLLAQLEVGGAVER